jgi:hypothetical protein
MKSPIGELGFMSVLRFKFINNWTPALDDMIEVYMDHESLLMNWMESNDVEDYCDMNMDQWMEYYQGMAEYIRWEIGEQLEACQELGDIETVANMYPLSVEYVMETIPEECEVTYEQVLSLSNPFTSIWRLTYDC